MFLSFATRDAPLVEAFRDHIGRRHPEIELLDHAVKNNYEKDWKRGCARKIDQSELLICLVGATTHQSQAVAWEVDHGLSLGKRIVAVNLAADGVRIPEVLVILRLSVPPVIAGGLRGGQGFAASILAPRRWWWCAAKTATPLPGGHDRASLFGFFAARRSRAKNRTWRFPPRMRSVRGVRESEAVGMAETRLWRGLAHHGGGVARFADRGSQRRVRVRSG